MILVGAVVGTVVAMFLLARMATQPQMSRLYGGLAPEAAGELVAALEARGVPFDVRGDEILVDSSARDQLRVELAREGLPAQGQSGYEILDNLSGFGTTTEMFQAQYWRAKEGELARTILSVPGVQKARVHIGAGARQPFVRAGDSRTAAVTVTMGSGRLTERSALAIRYLVALAVPSLDPDQVAVIDAENGVVLAPGDASTAALGEDVGDRRADQLEAELEDLLIARVGPGNVEISVRVETIMASRSETERRLDPDSQVVLSAEVQEEAQQNTGAATPVTVASNLPDGPATNNDNESRSNQSTENRTFGYSEIERTEVEEAGGVRRIGVAVFLNEVREVDEEGRVTYMPRSAEEIAAIERLVKASISFDPERGDTVTVESMRFAETGDIGSVAEEEGLGDLLEDNMPMLIQLGVLALVALALGLFVVRPIMKSNAGFEDPDGLALEGPDGALRTPDGQLIRGPDGSIIDQAALENGYLPEVSYIDPVTGQVVTPATAIEASAEAMATALGQVDAADMGGELSATTLERLQAVIADKTDAAGSLLREWLTEAENKPSWSGR